MAFQDGLLEVEEFRAPRRSLRVAVVTETYPPEVNGVAMTVARVVRGLQARGHAVQLVRPRQQATEPAGQARPEAAQHEQAPEHELLMRGLPIPRYPGLRMGVPAKRALVRHWSTHRPDIVHVATEGPLGWSALQACRTLKLPVTSDFRTNFHAYSRHYGVGWLCKPIVAYLRRFHNICASTMVPTEALRRDLERSGFDRLRVVGRGVDTELFDPRWRDSALRRSWQAEDDSCVLLYVGRLAAEKNLALLADAFETVQRKHGQARLVVVGDGPMREGLQRRLPQACFVGSRTGHDLARHYASADLFVFPSLTETFGNVTLEALSSGLPVVAFDCAAAARVVVPGQQGWLVAPGASDSFVDAVGAGVAVGREERQRMREAARASLVGYGWDAVVAQFESTLLDVLDGEGVLPVREPVQAQMAQNVEGLPPESQRASPPNSERESGLHPAG
jgi:glycosyltransferase involved in cell wall biosynthesis